MSRNNLWQICHESGQGNKFLTRFVVNTIRSNALTSKQVSDKLVISTERVRNWFYRNTGLTAWDLLQLMSEYEMISKFVEDMVEACKHYKKQRTGHRPNKVNWDLGGERQASGQ